jgi:hypothetical protein
MKRKSGKKDNVVVLARYSSKQRDSHLTMDEEVKACEENCQARDENVLKVFKVGMDYEPVCYKEAWKDLLKFCKNSEEEIVALVIYKLHNAFHSLEEYEFVIDELNDLGICLGVVEEDNNDSYLDCFMKKPIYGFVDVARAVRMKSFDDFRQNHENSLEKNDN